MTSFVAKLAFKQRNKESGRENIDMDYLEEECYTFHPKSGGICMVMVSISFSASQERLSQHFYAVKLKNSVYWLSNSCLQNNLPGKALSCYELLFSISNYSNFIISVKIKSTQVISLSHEIMFWKALLDKALHFQLQIPFPSH